MNIHGRQRSRQARVDPPQQSHEASSGSDQSIDGSRCRLALKRLSDVAVAGTVLLLTMPLLALVAIVMKVESPGPVISRQVRLGRNATHFDLLTLRCTTTDTGLITRVGRFLRLTSMCDVPQFWNVLRGDMSLLGPRPSIPPGIESGSHDDRPNRLTVIPGLIGFWQDSDGSQAS